uniref:Putative secreted salivary gland peptide n=1 Tax=Ixodes ricinus TaxID=34613 RepID=A0A6B0U9T8_IXORI
MLPIVTQIHRTKRKATAFVALIPVVVECLLVIPASFSRPQWPAFRRLRATLIVSTFVSQNTGKVSVAVPFEMRVPPFPIHSRSISR